VFGKLADLDPGAQPVEHEPLDEIGLLHCRAVDEIALAGIDDEEVEQDLALRLEKGGISGLPVRERLDVGGQEPLQEARCIGPGDRDRRPLGPTVQRKWQNLHDYCASQPHHLRMGRPPIKDLRCPPHMISSSEAVSSSTTMASAIAISRSRTGALPDSAASPSRRRMRSSTVSVST